MQQAKRVRMYNRATQMEEIEIVNEERYIQLRSMPFIHILEVDMVNITNYSTEVHELGGITPAFRKMWESL